ncbi:MAG: PhzF family phenazine biosynthesis protein, partial [Bryobacteraceae bacterium]
CGHATLASAHVLWEEGHLGTGAQARFHTLSGLLTADRRGEWIEMDFPALPVEATAPPAGLLEALGATGVRFVGHNRMDYFVELESEESVRALRPDPRSLTRVGLRGVIVTARGSDYDCVSRFFAPGAGVDEDPVTGSAHCALGPYWGERLGKSELVAYQASARGGVVRVRMEGARVKIGGQAVTVLRAEMAETPRGSAAAI